MGKGTCLLIINGLHHLIVFLSATLCSPGVAYMLKVLAINEVRRGPASEPSEPVTIETGLGYESDSPTFDRRQLGLIWNILLKKRPAGKHSTIWIKWNLSIPTPSNYTLCLLRVNSPQ